MASLSLRHIYKKYPGGVTAVSDFNLEIKDKEFIVFVGPSGCGKSTTLRMIAGLEEITEGELFIGDRLVNDVAPKDRKIAMVFQNYALYPHMTVFENMAFGLKLNKTPKEEIKRRVEEAARVLDITHLLDRKPKALSGGQRQRVAIGRAVVRNAKVFLMDEPLSNLDAKLRNQMRSELILLRNKINSTFVYVTHDQTEAMTLGDRIVIMKDGVIQQIGTPQNLFNHPVNTFVAGFIGSPQMNFFDAKLNENMDVELLGKTVATPENMKSQLVANNVSAQDIVLGVRPEYISLTTADDPEAIEGTTVVKELMGSSMHIHINTAENKNIIMIVRILDVGQEFLDSLKPETPIYFKWNPVVECLFSKETQQNLLPSKE